MDVLDAPKGCGSFGIMRVYKNGTFLRKHSIGLVRSLVKLTRFELDPPELVVHGGRDGSMSFELAYS